MALACSGLIAVVTANGGWSRIRSGRTEDRRTKLDQPAASSAPSTAADGKHVW
jgi:hypothetical protein